MVIVPCTSSSSRVTVPTKPSFLRTLASSSLSLEAGIATLVLRAVIALRIRLSISAIGSVIFSPKIDIRFLPAGLDDAGDIPAQRQTAEAKTAHVELAHIRATTATKRATAADTHFELTITFFNLLVQAR